MSEKKPDVGSKVVTFGFDKYKATVSFKSSIAYNEAINILLDGDKGEIIEAVLNDSRFTIENHTVRYVLFPLEPSTEIIYVKIYMEKGFEFEIPINGANRFRVAYKWLKDIVGMTPEGKIFKVSQDENKSSYFRHDLPILAVRSYKQ